MTLAERLSQLEQENMLLKQHLEQRDELLAQLQQIQAWWSSHPSFTSGYQSSYSSHVL